MFVLAGSGILISGRTGVKAAANAIASITAKRVLQRSARARRAAPRGSVRGSPKVSPPGRDQRATAVGEAGQHEQNTAAADTADDGERAALKRMALARDNYRIGKIPAMGSLSSLLSMRSAKNGSSAFWNIGSATTASSA